MKLKIYLITTAIALFLSMGAYFIDVRIAYGIMLSAIYSLINMLLLSVSMKAALGADNLNYAFLIPMNILRFSLLIAVLYIAVKNQDTFHMVGVAIGFTLFLAALFIDALTRKGRTTI